MAALGLAAGAVAATGAGQPAGAATSAAKSPILIGGQGDLATAPGVADGFLARITALNKAGGIDGHPVKFVGMLNDNEDPATNLADSQELVRNKHVVAIAPFISTDCTDADSTFLAQSKTPFVGWAIAACWLGSKWGIGINGAQSNVAVQSDIGMVQTLAAMKKIKGYHVSKPSDVKMALIGYDTPGGTYATKTLTAAAKATGFQVPYSQAPMPFNETNFAPYAQAIMSSGANAVYEVLDAPLAIGLAAALHSDGYKGFIVNGVTYFPGSLSSDPNEKAALQGVAVENEFPANQDSLPAVKTAEAQLAAIRQPPELTSGVSIGYWSGDVLAQLLQATAKRVGADHITGAAIQETAAKGWTYTGGLGTMSYPAAFNLPTGCGTLVQTTGSTYKLLEPYSCAGKLVKTGL